MELGDLCQERQGAHLVTAKTWDYMYAEFRGNLGWNGREIKNGKTFVLGLETTIC